MAKEAKDDGVPLDGPSRLLEELRERTETAKGTRATKRAQEIAEIADAFVEACRAKADNGANEHIMTLDHGDMSLAAEVCAALVDRGLPAKLAEAGGSAAIVGYPVIAVRW